MSCYVVAHPSAAPNAASFLTGNVIADSEYHVLSSWVDSPRIALQPASPLFIQCLKRTTEARRETSSIERKAQT